MTGRTFGQSRGDLKKPDIWTSPCVKDANGSVICAFFWPGHPVEETERAEKATYALGERVATLGDQDGAARTRSPNAALISEKRMDAAKRRTLRASDAGNSARASPR
jgi:hypothetical protein